LPKSARIIDVGGGDSNLVDFLLDLGYENVTVLDISKAALDRAKTRLGNRASKVNWIVSDVLEFPPNSEYDLWHDRAAFHFLNSANQIAQYTELARQAVTGFLVLGTFSEYGPVKCSGLQVHQYDERGLHDVFAESFEKVHCVNEDHVTPFGTKQNFLFCSFRRLEA